MCIYQDKNILVIDDCEDNLLLLQLILESQGYTFESACNGMDGLAAIKKNLPDLIILDLMMPDISGLEVIKQVKAIHNLQHIPILLLTANKNLSSKELIGADELCYKPFDIENLLTKVKLLLLCGENTNSSTLIIDLDQKDPLIEESRKLYSIIDKDHLVLETLQQQGYEIGESQIFNNK